MHSIKTIFFLVILLPHFVFAQRGKNGAKTVTGTEIVNEYTYLTSTAALGATTITVQNSALNANSRFSSPLQQGDLLFIYNIQGVEINGIPDPGRLEIGLPHDETWGSVTNYRNCGQYEFAEVSNVINGTQIELMCGLIYNHTIGSFNEKVVVVRVPRYQSLIVNAGAQLTCDAWNGQTGGTVIVEVEGNTTINGSVDVSEKGFRGGELVNDPVMNYQGVATGDKVDFGGQKGEGIAGYQTEYNIFGGGYARGAAANAGGGGSAHNAGGGGGANASKSGATWTGKGIPLTTVAAWANAWNLEQPGLATMSSSGGGRGGNCWSANLGDAYTLPVGDGAWGGHGRWNYGGFGGRPLDYSTGRIFLGGGGGAGHQNDNQGGAGGNGGGLIFISSYGNVGGTGQLIANGENGEGSEGASAPLSGSANKDGSGGGGAGGTIIVKTSTTVSGVSFEANGGLGGNQVLVVGIFGGNKNEAQGPGGGGAGGYIGISNLGLTANLQGGVNGTTNSDALTEFPPNGATKGDTGLIALTDVNVNFYADNDTICGGGSVTISPTITGALPSGQLNWYNSYTSSTVIHTGNTYTTPVLTATTTYYFGACGVPFRDSATIFVSNAVVIDTNSMSIQHESCAGNDGSILGINATGGTGTLNYYWNNNLSSSLDTTGLSGGVFNLIVNDSLGCADTVQNITVNASSSPIINTSFMSLVKDSCGNNTGEINGVFITGGSGSYFSTVDGNGVPNLNVNGLSAGNHQLIVSDNNTGCEDTVDVTIQAVPNPTVFLGNDTTICTGQTLTLDATTTGATYLWKGNSTNATLVVDSADTYFVEVSVGSCSATDTIEVFFTNGQSVFLGNDTTLCTGQTLLLDATSPGATYQWQDASINPTFNVTTGGQYHVTTDNNGCINRDTINVLYSASSINLGNDTSICNSDTLLLDATSPGATYLWSDGSTDSTLKAFTTNTYWVEVTQGNCTVSDTINVTTLPVPVVNLGNDTTLCPNETLMLDATNSGATYLWQDASINATYLVNSAGQYYVNVDVSGCETTDTINVTYNSLQPIDFGNDTSICFPDTLLLDATSSGATYLWSDGSTDSTLKVFATNTYWAQVTQGGCMVADTIKVTLVNLPVVNLGADTLLCANQTLLLDATTSGGTYSWQDASSSATYNVTANGQYYVEVSVNGCSASDTINVAYNTLLSVNLGNDTSLCDNATLLLDATNASATYLWQDASINPTYTVTTAGVYKVEVTQGNCTATDSINVTYNYSPVVNLGVDTLICDRDELYLDVTTPGASYLWHNGATIPNQIFFETGSYSVNVTNACGSDSDTINLQVQSCDCEVFLPNSFTPNGDGLNDTWEMPNACEFYQFELRVFNRRGMPIYHTNDPKFKWDGSYNGKVHESAVYPYNVKYRTKGSDVEIHYKAGHVTMVR